MTKTPGSILLDTSIIVDYMRGDQRLVPQFMASRLMYVPLVVLGELYFGVERAVRRDNALAQVREFLKITTLLLPDESTAEHYGHIKSDLIGIGRPIPENDLWIAAAARQHDLPVATPDAHFAVIPHLKTVYW